MAVGKGTKGPKVFNFGGGVQSTAALVLAVKGEIDYQTFLFCDVGADSESPHTIDYVRDHSAPYAKANGVNLITLARRTRDGKPQTLMQNIANAKKSLPLPVRMANGSPGNRTCTDLFKIKPCDKWLKENGATKENPGVSGLGISIDEIQRMRVASGRPHVVLEYPLINLRIDRDECKRIILAAGLPVPPKSSCWFCPFRSVKEWARIQRNEPAMFQRAVELEQMLNRRRESLGKDHVYLSSRCKPLDRAFSQLDLFSTAPDDCCDSGHCMT